LGKASPAEAQILSEDKSYFFSASFIASILAYNVGTPKKYSWFILVNCKKK